MCILKTMAVPKKKTPAVLFVICSLGLVNPFPAGGCSCVWKGPFFVAAQDAPLVVIGKIIRHHPGKSPTMDVLVVETLKGGLLDSGLSIQMGNGMHCRPSIDLFPVGTS